MSNLFLPYQEDYILDPARYKIVVKPRQCGITFAEAFWSFRRRMSSPTPINHIFCSLNLDTAKEFINYVKKFAEIYNLTLSEGEEKEIGVGEDKFTSHWVIFPNGSKIIVRSNPRGLTGDLTWDEAAGHENAEDFYANAASVTDWNDYHFHVISTHKGAGTVFHQLVEASKQGTNAFKLFSWNIEDCARMGLAVRQKPELKDLPIEEAVKIFCQSKKDKCLNVDQYNQEYMAAVLSSDSMIKSEVYDLCVHKDLKITDEIPKSTGDLYLGIDVGRTKDLTVLYFIEEGIDKKNPNKNLQRVFRTIAIKTLKGMPFESQFNIISSYIVNNRKIKRCIIEKNGIGAGLSEMLFNAHQNVVEEWQTTGSNKGILVERLAGFIAQNRIGLSGDKDIKEDFLSMQRVVNNGKTNYTAGTKTSHGDYIMACSFALEAACNNDKPFGFVKV